MTEDPRCCGTGTCLINAAGECWCGQRWDGEKMCHAPLAPWQPAAPAAAPVSAPSNEPQDQTPEAG